MITTTREGCGTYQGLRLHQVHGEPPCSECLHGEAVRRIEHEGFAGRPSPPPVLPPVTPEQAARNRAILLDAIRPPSSRRRAA